MNLNIAPGARVRIRSEEWLVRTAEPSADGGRLIVCEGISDLVRGFEAHFLTELDDDIQVLDPAATTLVADESPQRSGWFSAAGARTRFRPGAAAHWR